MTHLAGEYIIEHYPFLKSVVPCNVYQISLSVILVHRIVCLRLLHDQMRPLNITRQICIQSIISPSFYLPGPVEPLTAVIPNGWPRRYISRNDSPVLNIQIYFHVLFLTIHQIVFRETLNFLLNSF